MRWLVFAAAVRFRGSHQEPTAGQDEASENWAKNPWPYNKFAHVYVATMPREAYRMRRMRDVLSKLNLPDYQVWSASDGKDPQQVPRNLLSSLRRADHGCGNTWIPGLDQVYMDRPWAHGEQEATLGCYLTHLRILRDALAKGYSNVLIFEDDLDPVMDAETRFQMVRTMPKDWDMLYLGWNHHVAGRMRSNEVHQHLMGFDCMPFGADGLCKLKEAILQQTHAIAINGKAIGPLVKFLEEALQKQNACAVDQMYRAFFIQHPHFNVFAAQTPVFEQMSSKNMFPSQITPEWALHLEKQHTLPHAEDVIEEAKSEASPKDKLKKLIFR